MEKVSCGGFYLGDNLSIENVDGKEILNVSGSLPEVTVSDNGKILGVVDGAWGKTDAPSGGGAMVIEGDANATDESTIVISNLTKTFAEVKAAVKSGKSVILKVDMETAYGESLLLIPASAYTIQTYGGSTQEVVQFVLHNFTAMYGGSYSNGVDSITVVVEPIE